MFTVCSKCNLRLTVTATDLRAAQGYVRCGRCHNVFNALAALADEPGRPAEATSTADTQSRLALTPPAPEPPAPEPERLEPEAAAENDTSLEFNPASTNIYEVFIEAAHGDRTGTGTFESIVLIGEESAATPDPVDPVIAPQAVSAPAAPAPAPAAAVSPPADNVVTVDVASLREALAEPDLPQAPPPPEAAAVARTAAGMATPVTETPISAPPVPETPLDAAADSPPPATDTPAEPPAAEIVEAPFLDAAAADEIVSAMDVPAPLLTPEAAASRMPRWALPGAGAALVLCLLAQVVHHYRSALADTSLLRRPLTALYQGLGQPLELRWDIANYEIRQLGATNDGAATGDLVVRASISNRAPREQPLPLLRVVMQDRFGNRVAARDLKPAEYLGRGAPEVSLMAPGQRVDVQVAFQDPGQTATGFEIDACMARHDHNVTCANDPGTH